MEPLTFRYAVSRLVGDYVRATLGLLITGLPMSQLPVTSIGFWLLLICALMFAGLGLHTIYRQIARIVMTDDGIESYPRKAMIEWKVVREIKLSYFSTRTDRKNGWMQLSIYSRGGRLRIDSRIDNFHTVASTVLDNTRHSNVLLSEASSSNFEALGLKTWLQSPG